MQESVQSVNWHFGREKYEKMHVQEYLFDLYRIQKLIVYKILITNSYVIVQSWQEHAYLCDH